jgi:hypothetical protein
LEIINVQNLLYQPFNLLPMLQKMTFSAFLVCLTLVFAQPLLAQKPLSSASSGSFASYGAHKSTIEVGLNITEGSTIVLPKVRYRYFLNDRMALRGTIEAATNTDVERVYQNPNFTGNEGTRTVSDRQWGLQTGFEYHPSGTKRLSPYFGAVVGLNAGRNKEDWKDYNIDSLGDGVYEFQTKANITAPFLSFNFGAVAGVDFYLVENLYLGLEMNWGMTVRNNRPTELSFSSLSSSDTRILEPSSRNVSSNFGALPSIRVGWRF